MTGDASSSPAIIDGVTSSGLPSDGGAVATIFYDGTCGLCHWSVRFVLARDRRGEFRFAPLGGETFFRRVPADDRADLPDSFVVVTADGRLLMRAAGVQHVAGRLGGVWRVLASASRILPAALADRFYDLVAATRYRLFRRPEQVCPVVPANLRSRFDG